MISIPKSIGGSNDFRVMVDQLSEVKACAILQIHRTTLKRLLRPDSTVPRAYLLALFWETSYGRSLIDSDHLFEIQLLHHKISFLKMENARLTGIIAKMEDLMDFGSANAPAFKAAQMI